MNPSFEEIKRTPIYHPAIMPYLIDSIFITWDNPTYSFTEYFFMADTNKYATVNQIGMGVPLNIAGFQYAR
ncbi:MAG TPA: hypothetical protein DIW27_03025, partial [Cytophagales bacterium]|nr:hypothetical protein [Cytophagales bacterium]